MERDENEYPMVVAMWGAPCTGKTTIAKGIAAKLKCPLISFEYFLDQVVSWQVPGSTPGPNPPNLFTPILLGARPPTQYIGEDFWSFLRRTWSERETEEAIILPDLFGKVDVHPEPMKLVMSKEKGNDHEDDADAEQHCSSSSAPSAADKESVEAKQLMDRAFSMAIQVAETHLSMGISVIIDSLFLHSYLQQLASLKTYQAGVKIVVVACQPMSRTQWKNMFYNRETSSDRDKWYKPGSPAYTGILSRYYSLDYDFPRVSILQVDSFSSFQYDKLVKVLRDLSCSRGHRVELDAWKPIHYSENGENDQGGVACTLKLEMGRLPYDDATHGMLDLHTKLPKSLQRDCGACAKLVIDQEAYTCRCGCDLVLHNHCAESLTRGDCRVLPPHDVAMDLHTFAKLLQERWLGPEYSFPEKLTCKQCRETHKDFSYDCTDCFSETLHKYSPMERVIHGCSIIGHYLGHELELEAKQIPHINSYVCAACGKLGSYSGYSCFYCRIHYHVGCVSLPDSIQHEHGGWEHPMELRLRTPVDEEGYVCDVCYRDIDREFWYYECKMSCFISHIECLVSTSSKHAHNEITTSSGTDHKLPNHLKEPIVRFQIPQGRRRCTNCRIAGQNFSLGSYCGNCVFENLAFEMKPAVVRHRSHDQQHFLSLWIRPIPREARDPYESCFVCGEALSFCSYKCRKCHLRCHVGCTQLPPFLEHQDGRSRTFSVAQKDRDDRFECCVCHKIGNQAYQHYCCEDGSVDRAHPHCIAFNDP